MKEFFRGPAWVSSEAREAWQPKISAAANAWKLIERGAVALGCRPSALVHATGSDLVELSRWASFCTLEVTVLEESTIASGYMSGATADGAPGFRLAIHRPGLSRSWQAAWAATDDRAIGALLAYPPCCTDFFMRTWGAGARDTTMQMAAAGTDGPHEVNGLLRWLGLRMVSHLPCSFSCEESAVDASHAREVAKTLNLDEEMGWIEEALGWRTAFSALHGIGEVQTPIFKFAFSTDYTAQKVAFVREGSRSANLDPPRWTDNGFSSREAMEMAHAPILKLVEGGSYSRILDLGCGDGELLSRLSADDRIGIDANAKRVARGRRRHPELRLEHRQIEDWHEGWHPEPERDLVLLCPSRLVEIGPADASRVRDLLRGRRVLAYTYSDNGSLVDAAAKAGLRLTSDVLSSMHAQAAQAEVP